MNISKNIVGQIVAAGIIAIPAAILAFAVYAFRSASKSGGTITMIAGWVLGAILVSTAVYLTTRLIRKHRWKASGIIGGIKIPFAGSFSGLIGKWWRGLDEKSSPGQKFVLLVIALLVAYAEYSWNSTVWAALTLILIGSIISPPKSKIVKAFVYLDLVILVAAVFLPGFAQMRHTSYEIAKLWSDRVSVSMTQYAGKLKDCNESKAKCVEEPTTVHAQQGVPSLKAKIQSTPQVLHLMPGWNSFRKAEVPHGAKIIESVEWSCEDGCVIQVDHDMNRLCEVGWDTEYDGERLWKLGTYNDSKCRVATVPASTPGAIRYQEQFLVPQGANDKNFYFPSNLLNIIVSFGTNEKMGPRDIVVNVITSH